jgi:hypothetical protein
MTAPLFTWIEIENWFWAIEFKVFKFESEIPLRNATKVCTFMKTYARILKGHSHSMSGATSYPGSGVQSELLSSVIRDAGTMWRQGGQIFVKEHFWNLNWYILRDVCKTSGVELRLIMFSIYWMIGMWGSSQPGDCAILGARWLHFLRFLKQIRKIIALTFLKIRYFAKALKGHLCPPCPSW